MTYALMLMPSRRRPPPTSVVHYSRGHLIQIVPSLEQPRQALPTIPEASLSNPAGPLKHYASSWNEPAGDSRIIICSLWGRGSVNGREIGVGKWWWVNGLVLLHG